ncbi:MAG: polyprenol monophosphomannose synthase [Chloroflexi bacterium]|nr:polyprenol monophosphomannose synthase [Chloroflexota bacterium]
MKTVVVLPTYNEAENLPRMVVALLALGVPGIEVLVVDDGSPDGTGELADKLAAEHPRQITVLHRKGKMGLGSAYVAGFGWALQRGADRVVQMDCDFSHPVHKILEFLEQTQGCDVVVGSRYIGGGSVDPGWSWRRKALSAWGNRYARAVMGLRVKDATGGFKCFTRQALEALPLSLVGSGGFTFQVEINYLCKLKGHRVVEVPILFTERTRGKSKMSLGIVLEGLWRVWQIRFKDYRSGTSAARMSQEQV